MRNSLDTICKKHIIYNEIWKDKPATATIIRYVTDTLAFKYPAVERLSYRTEKYKNSKAYQSLKKPRIWIKDIYGAGYKGKIGQRQSTYIGSNWAESSQYRNITSSDIYQKPIPRFPFPNPRVNEWWKSSIAEDGISTQHNIAPFKEFYIRLGYEGMGHPTTQASLFVSHSSRHKRTGTKDFHDHANYKFMRRGAVAQDSIFPPSGRGFVAFNKGLHNNRAADLASNSSMSLYFDRFYRHRNSQSFVESFRDRNPELLEGDFSLQYAYVSSTAPQQQGALWSWSSEGEVLIRFVLSTGFEDFYPEYMEDFQKQTTPLTTPSEDLFDGETPIPYFSGKRYYEDGKRWLKLANQTYVYPLLTQPFCCDRNGKLLTTILPPSHQAQANNYAMVTDSKFFPNASYDFNWRDGLSKISDAYLDFVVHRGAPDRIEAWKFPLPTYEGVLHVPPFNGKIISIHLVLTTERPLGTYCIYNFSANELLSLNSEFIHFLLLII